MILMLISNGSYKEFILPNKDNMDYTILVDRKIFGISKSFYLSFEVIGHRWRICTDNKIYQLVHHKVTEKFVELNGGEVINIKTFNGEIIKMITTDTDLSLMPYKKLDIVRTKEITIGKDDSNMIAYSFLRLVSSKHCSIVNRNGEHYILDSSSNGVYVNNKRVSSSYKLNYGDIIDVFGLKIIYFQESVAVGSHIKEARFSDNLLEITVTNVKYTENHIKHETKFFNRSPRIFPPICYDKIAIEPPTNPQFSKKRSMLTTIGPSFTMAIPMLIGCGLMILSSTTSGMATSAFMYTGIITALGSAILGAFWAFLNIRETKKMEFDEEAKRFNLYGNYLIEISNYLKEKYKSNKDALFELYPSASDCSKYGRNTPQLWNRNVSHDDFLFYRLGLGDINFQMDIQIPKDKFTMEYDPLRDKSAMIYENFRVLKNVPVGVNIADGNIFGIVGGKNKKYVPDIVNNLIVQIAATTCYTDAKIAFCLDSRRPSDIKNYSYIKWLPHVWSENKKIRFFATDKQESADIFFELSNVLRRRVEAEEGSFGRKQSFKPHYFLFVSDVKILEDEIIGKYVFDNNNNYGITTFIMTDYCHNLPNSCENIIRKDDDFSGVYNVFNNSGNLSSIKYDSITNQELFDFAKRISDIQVQETEESSGLVSSLNFFDMYNAESLESFNISEHWRKNRTYNSMRALIGKKADGTGCYLDIHEKYHGPHGLVAGTTGSGKSELMQTFILSLAINYNPEDVAFFIIDFKGGGMANLFSKLPHMAGQISNLSGNQINRAMISIKSENLRRQKLFSEFGVNNINLYTRLYKSGEATVPIPHLLIIIDEFAELKKEEPDFMRELISVAQVGRSLGVHLVLATQKPSGTVDDNIWSNAKFRLCLRVQDRQDSNDMLHKPDAAYITQAGRCYLQVGNDEIYELFQSGWSGAVFDEKNIGNKNEIATMITPTGKTALVGSYTKMKRKEKERLDWYGFLYELIINTSGKSFDKSMLSYNNDFAIEIINLAQEKGYNIGTSNSEIKALKGFISCMPERIMSSEEAAEYIFAKASASNIRLPEYKDKTQLEALVEYIAHIAEKENFSMDTQLWLPVLKKKIILSELWNKDELFNGSNWYNNGFSLNAVVGLYDDPKNQAQLPFEIDFINNGHIAVCGSIVSGKSTFLQTAVFSLAMKYSPDYLNFYFLDFSSGMLDNFSDLPHTGGVIKENDTDSIEKFFNMISNIVEERKKLFSGGNFMQYVKANGVVVPAIVIAIDNFASFKEKTDNKFEDKLVILSREGISYGIFLMITSAGFGLSEIQNRIGDNIRTVIALELGDKFKYMDVLRTTHIDVMPESGIKGRGIGYVDGKILEFQTAVAVDAEDDYKRNSIIKKLCGKMKESWNGKKPVLIPHIPEAPTYELIAENEEYKKALKSSDLLPFAYKFDDASIYGINLSDTYCYSITGKKRTGKTNILKLLIMATVHRDSDAVIIEKDSRELKMFADNFNFKYLSSDYEVLEYFKGLTNEFVERNTMKKSLVEEGLSNMEIFRAMQKKKQIFIFIADVNNFIDSIYHPENNIGNMSDFFENIFEKGYLHNIFFCGCVNTDDALALEGVRAYKLFTSYKTGVHVGGNLAAQRVFNFQNIHYSQMSRVSPKGEGFVPVSEDDTMAEKVIIPLFGGKI